MPDTPQPTSSPVLTPQFCVNTTALRDFLRLSRSTVDDSISTHLNAMITPARTNPFLPSILGGGQRPPELPPPPRGSRRNIPSETCARFKQDILFPTWQRRDRVLRYCATVAEPRGTNQPVPTVSKDEFKGHRDFWGVPQDTDERLDPYSARDYSYNRESAVERLRTVLGNEDVVERIVRERTWGVLGERCVGKSEAGASGVFEEDWRESYRRWSERQDG